MYPILRPSCGLLFIIGLLPLSLQAFEVYSWTGNASTSLTDPRNWNPTVVPAFGTRLDACLNVGETQGAQNRELTYTASQGTTSFALAKGGCGSVGHQTSAVLNISGGSLNFDSAENRPDEGGFSLWIGNGPAPGHGTLNLSGGEVTCKSQVIVGRDGSTGALNITGGTLVAGEDGFAIGCYGTAAKTGRGCVNLSGSGKLIIRGAPPASGRRAALFIRPGAPTAENYINFAARGAASLSLPTAADNFPALVSGGYVRIEGEVVSSIARFQSVSQGPQTIYRVAEGSSVLANAKLSAPSGSPTVVEELDNSVTLSPRDAVISGQTAKIGFRDNIGAIVQDWTDPSDSFRWNARVRSPGIFDVIINYSTVAPEPGSLVEVAVTTQGVQARLDSCENWESSCTKFLGQVKIPQAGVVGINLSALEKKGSRVMDLRCIKLRRSNDTSLSTPAKPAVHPASP